MSNEDDEFLRMAKECGATTQEFPPNYSTITFHKADYLALCKKVQDKQKEKDGFISKGYIAIRKGE
jgi:hypothetical protein